MSLSECVKTLEDNCFGRMWLLIIENYVIWCGRINCLVSQFLQAKEIRFFVVSNWFNV